MYAINTSNFFLYLQSLWHLITGALGFDPAAFAAIQLDANGGLAVLTILFLAGISRALGQCVVLLANKVSRRRFVVSLLVSGLTFIVGILLWASTIWLIGRFVFQVQQSFANVLLVVGLAYAPLLLGFLILLPYMGSFISHILEIWALLLVLLAVYVTLQLGIWQGLLCTLLGWLMFQALEYIFGKPITVLLNRLMRITTGTPFSIRRIEDLGKLLAENTTERPPE